MPDEIIEAGLDPNYIKSDGEQLSAHVGSAWSIAVDIKEHAGRSEAGRQAAILATELEKIRALLAYWHFDGVRIEKVQA